MSGPTRACDQWTHVEAFAVPAGSRRRAFAPAPNKSVRAASARRPRRRRGRWSGFETQGKLFGYDALNKLREMYVLVCGVDSGANDACVSASPASSVGVLSAAIRTFLQRCEVDDLCDLDDMESYKYHALIRTSALPAAGAAIALAREVKSPAFELATAARRVHREHESGPERKIRSQAFTTWMSTSRRKSPRTSRRWK